MQNDNMQKIDFQKINEIANQISITEYLRSIGIEPATKQGRNWYYYCNNSNENHASCCVDTSVNRYTCFSCHLDNGYGNLLTYLTKELHLSFSEACKRIIDYAHLDPTQLVVAEKSETVKFLESLKREAERRPREVKRVYEDYSEYDKFSKEPSELWQKEGITAEVQRLYDIRTDPLRNRILYPLIDSSGRYITKKQRSTLPIDLLKKLGKPKYMIDGHIGCMDFVVGEQQALDTVKQTREIIVCEGIKSVMKLRAWGICNVVSAETSLLNKSQIQLLISLNPKNVVMAMDQDKSFKDVKSHLWILPRFTNVSIVLDRNGLLQPKDSPVDRGEKTWMELYNNRIKIN